MSLVLTAHQPTYWPWIGLLDKIRRADAFVSFDAVQMEDSGFENRQRFRKAGGGWQWLTVPVRRSRDKRICDLEIATEHDWQRKHWRSLEMAYSKATFWGEYRDQLALIFEIKWTTLAAIDAVTRLKLEDWFGIKRDERLPLSAMGIDPSIKGSALVLEMCKRVGATKYIFGACGRDYADVEAFERAGIEVEFQEFTEPDYPGKMVGGPPLSALDALLWAGPEWCQAWARGER